MGALVVIGAVVGAYRLTVRRDGGGQLDGSDRSGPGADLSEEARRVPIPRLPDLARAADEATVPPPVAPQPELSAKEHRDQAVNEIRASGPDQQHLLASAKRVAEGWSAKIAKMDVAAKLGPFECHAKGCFVTEVHKSEDDVEEAMRLITRTSEFSGWQSGKMRSGVISREDGRVEVTWFLFAPPKDEAPLAATLPPENLDDLAVP